MTQLINEAKRLQELAGINEVKVQPEYSEIHYIIDEEGMEPPLGPFPLFKAKAELAKLGSGWNIVDEQTAKEIYDFLN
jgi:hypothetical protein